MNKKIRVAILGMGNMGIAHSNNLLMMEDVELVSMCSKRIDAAKKYVDKKNLSINIYEDFDEMIEKEDIDVLYVCLPPFAHTGQIEKAARKKIHIFVEKPIALNVERAESIAKAVNENKVLTQVGYHMRFGSAVKYLFEQINNGTAGKPLLYTANYECNSLHTPWWMDVEKSGGQVFEQIIHLYDMAYYILGLPEQVNGYIANLNHNDLKEYTVEDTSISSIKFRNGTLAGISGTNCAIPNKWNAFFKIVCQNLVAEFKDFNHAKFIFTKDNNKVVEISDDINAMLEEDKYFIEVVKGNKPEFASINDGLIGLKMVSAVVESSKNNGEIIKIK